MKLDFDQKLQDLRTSFKPKKTPPEEEQKLDKQRESALEAAQHELTQVRNELHEAERKDELMKDSWDVETDLYVMKMLSAEDVIELVVVHLIQDLTAAQVMRNLEKLVMMVGDHKHELGLKPIPPRPRALEHLSNPYQMDVDKFFQVHTREISDGKFTKAQLLGLVVQFMQQCGVRLAYAFPEYHKALQATIVRLMRRLPHYTQQGTAKVSLQQFAQVMLRRPWRQLLPEVVRQRLVQLLMREYSPKLCVHGGRFARVWDELGPEYGDRVTGARVLHSIRALWKGSNTMQGHINGGLVRKLFESFVPVWHGRKLLGLYQEYLGRFPPTLGGHTLSPTRRTEVTQTTAQVWPVERQRATLFVKRDGTCCPFRSWYNPEIVRAHLEADHQEAILAAVAPRAAMHDVAAPLMEHLDNQSLKNVASAAVQCVLDAASTEGNEEELELARKEIRKAVKRLRKKNPPFEAEAQALEEFYTVHAEEMLRVVKKVDIARDRIEPGVVAVERLEKVATSRMEALMSLRIRRAAKAHQAAIEHMEPGVHKQQAQAEIDSQTRIELSFAGFAEMLHMRPWVHFGNQQVLEDTRLWLGQHLAQQLGFLQPFCSTKSNQHAIDTVEHSFSKMIYQDQCRLATILSRVQSAVSLKENYEHSLLQQRTLEWHQEKLEIEAYNASRDMTKQAQNVNTSSTSQAKPPEVPKLDQSRAQLFHAQVSRLKVVRNFWHVAALLVRRPWCWMLTPRIQAELLAYLQEARCLKLSHDAQILQFQPTNLYPPAMHFLFRELRVQETFFSLVGSTIPKIAIKTDEVTVEPEGKDEEAIVVQQSTETHTPQMVCSVVALGAAKLLSEIGSGIPAALSGRAMAILARQLRGKWGKRALDDEFSLMDFARVLLCKPWSQALSQQSRTEALALLRAEECHKKVILWSCL